MVMKLMRWPSWPPYSSKKLEALLFLQRIEGLESLAMEDDGEGLVVEVKWKGQKGMALSSWRRSIKRNFTQKGVWLDGKVVEWNEEFGNFCTFWNSKEDVFNPWEIAFTVFQRGENEVSKKKSRIVGTSALNLSEYVSATDDEREIHIQIPLKLSTDQIGFNPLLWLSLKLLEVRSGKKLSRAMQRSIVPVTLSPPSALDFSTEKDRNSAFKSRLERVRIFRHCISAGKTKEMCSVGEHSDHSFSKNDEDTYHNDRFNIDSINGGDRVEKSEKSNADSISRKPFDYETLDQANRAKGSISSEEESWIYYRKGEGFSDIKDSDMSVSEKTIQPNMKRKILSWPKRKLSFGSTQTKGEPLLKKQYGEDGGDDIDFDRRQLCSCDKLYIEWHKLEGSESIFGEDNFTIGSWDEKEVTSRDGHFKLKTKVFFASIDQRSERAAGESACTALVAVIADWFQSNKNELPTKSEFDTLIREGSTEWRNLCENNDYLERFPDKHFDLDTIIQAKIRPLSVVSQKSFIGFFHPQGLEGGSFDFLQDSMSFDSIWNEISHFASNCLNNNNNNDSLVYIVSWNDHFFILKIEKDAYYIIDTLGERLHEGCNQAYILKFDRHTIIHRIPNKSEALNEKKSSIDEAEEDNSKETSVEAGMVANLDEPGMSSGEEEVVCRGKETCKEYIKSFLAAIPIRELQADIKKGLLASIPLHHRLQIEFHHTKFLEPVEESFVKETKSDAPAMEMEILVS